MTFEEFLEMSRDDEMMESLRHANFKRKHGMSLAEMKACDLDVYERTAYDVLKNMVISNKDYTSSRELFIETFRGEDGETDTRPNVQARKIGERLNKRGGLAKMQRVGECFAEFCREYARGDADRWIIATDGRDLEMCWDGIGEWRM